MYRTVTPALTTPSRHVTKPLQRFVGRGVGMTLPQPRLGQSADRSGQPCRLGEALCRGAGIQQRPVDRCRPWIGLVVHESSIGAPARAGQAPTSGGDAIANGRVASRLLGQWTRMPWPAKFMSGWRIQTASVADNAPFFNFEVNRSTRKLVVPWSTAEAKMV